MDAERETRDRAVEGAAAGYFAASDHRVGLLDQIYGIEVEMAAEIAKLRTLKEPVARIAILLGIDAREVRRLIAVGLADDQGEAENALAEQRQNDLLLDALNRGHMEGSHDDATTSEAPGDLVGANAGTS
jgi:hypothetical protein